jgi:hypothetical protein
MLVSVGLVGCSSASGGRTSGTAVTFPPPDRVADLSVRIRADATFDQVSDLMLRLNLRPDSMLDGYRIDYEARTVLVYVLNDATPAQRQRLREMLLQSSIVVSIEP